MRFDFVVDSHLHNCGYPGTHHYRWHCNVEQNVMRKVSRNLRWGRWVRHLILFYAPKEVRNFGLGLTKPTCHIYHCADEYVNFWLITILQIFTGVCPDSARVALCSTSGWGLGTWNPCVWLKCSSSCKSGKSILRSIKKLYKILYLRCSLLC